MDSMQAGRPPDAFGESWDLRRGSLAATAPDGAGARSFGTAGLPPADQFEAWRQFNDAAIDLRAVDGPTTPFEARMDVWDIGGLVYTLAQLPVGIEREWTHWRHRSLDHWCLVLPNPRQMPAGQRIIGFRSLGEPFAGSASDSDIHTLYLPRALFGSRAAALDHVPRDIPDAGLGALLADYLLNLHASLPRMSKLEMPRLLEATRAMILACTFPTRDHVHEARSVIGETMFERARQLIEQHLLSPELGADFVAGRLGLSRSNLYRLFENEGGVERFIRRRRLQDAHAVLSGPDNGHSIQTIGEARGFQDAASFSRAFRREFGYSPGEARLVMVRPSAGLPRRAGSEDFRMLGTLLREL